jgi:hypothetical protein
MRNTKSRADYMRRYRASKRLKELTCTRCGTAFQAAHKGRKYCSDACRAGPPTRGSKQKAALKEAWELGRQQLAELGTPIYVQLDCSSKVTLKAGFPGALGHAFIILSGCRAGELSWMYDLICAAVFPDGICRRWKTLHPAFWLKTSALRAPITEKLKEYIAPTAAEIAETAKIVRQGAKLREQETVLHWSSEKTAKYWEYQKSQNEKLDWIIARQNEAAHGRRIKPKNSLDDLK